MTAITGLILAGGAGSRTGGQDKGLIPWRGRPLVAHVAERLAPQVSQLLIGCNRNQQAYAEFGDVIAGDLRSGYQGPLAGIEAALPHIRTPYLLLSPCDTPAIPMDMASRLLEALSGDALDVVYARCAQRDHYLHALLRSECLESLKPFLDGGQRAVYRWYGELTSGAEEFKGEAAAFMNINSPEAMAE